MEALTVKAALQISRTAEEVFEAIVDPDIMCNYFISKGSDRLETGRTVYWQFPEFPVDSPVRVRSVVPASLVSFAWDAATGEELTVEMRLEQRTDGSTVVRVAETGMPMGEAGMAWIVSNTEGWANFLACLKAWLEYGINLRKGAFDFMVETSS